MGYLPRDLLMSRGFVPAPARCSTGWRAESEGRPARCWSAWPRPIRTKWGGRYSTAPFCCSGGAAGPAFHKTLLPTYDVFDEDRYFEPAAGPQILRIGRLPPGHQHLRGRVERPRLLAAPPLPRDPIEELAAGRRAGHRESFRFALHRGQATPPRGDARRTWRASTALPVVYVNQVGGDDDFIFDGRSGAFDAQGRLFARAKGFEEDVLLVDLEHRTRRDRRRRFSAGGRNLERAGAGRPRLRPENRLQPGAVGPFRRRRFGPYGGHSRRCAGPGKRARRADALALLKRAAAWAIPSRWRETWGSRPSSCRLRTSHEDLRADARRRISRLARGRDRGEHSIAHSRQPPDGALE